MEERGLVGLKARGTDGSVLGRIVDVLAEEASGEVTHVVVEGGAGEQFEVPITETVLDPEADFAGFDADPSDEEPGDHSGDAAEEEWRGYAPARSDSPEDYAHEGQFVAAPQDPDEALTPEEAEREAAEASGWEDEGSTSPDSGYPRNDAYIDPDTGREERDPLLEENETLADDVEDLLADTGLRVRAAGDGVVQLTGSVASREDLDALIEEVLGLDEVLEVDTTDVEIG